VSNKILLALVSVLLALFLASRARADELRLLELDEMSMSYGKLANNRDMYWPYDDPARSQEHEYWLYSVATKFDLTLLGYDQYRLRWKNEVRGDSTNVQFRRVMWDFRWGLELGEKLEAYYSHRSEHIMEAAPPEPRTYPLRNEIGLEITFYKRETK
jgi:hypothetical protein